MHSVDTVVIRHWISLMNNVHTTFYQHSDVNDVDNIDKT